MLCDRHAGALSETPITEPSGSARIELISPTPDKDPYDINGSRTRP
jgi:hypothetical protein